MNNFLVENELGYTNHIDGNYVTENNATHIAVCIDGKWTIEEYDRGVLDLDA